MFGQNLQTFTFFALVWVGAVFLLNLNWQETPKPDGREKALFLLRRMHELELQVSETVKELEVTKTSIGYETGTIKDSGTVSPRAARIGSPLNEASVAPNEASVSFGETNRETVPSSKHNGHSKCGSHGIVALTYASHRGRDDRFCRAAESAVRHNIPWQILGWGVKWEGLSQKLQGSLDAVRALPPDCIVLFSDAFDVLFTAGLSVIKERFLATGKPLLFAGECGCWPQVVKDKDRKLPSGTICNKLYPRSPTPYRFLNSGAWVGYASHASRLLEAVVDKANSQFGLKTNDQEMVSDMYIDRLYNISLDHYASIFQCMHATGSPPLPNCDPWPDMRETNGTWRNTRTKTTPALFHFNGGGKQHHLEMERRVWYKKNNGGGVADSAVETSIYDFPLRLADRAGSFGEICPGHLNSVKKNKRK